MPQTEAAATAKPAEPKPAVAAPASVAPAAPETPVKVDDFCRRQSMKDKRIALLAAFHRSEKVAGREKDTPTNFAARLNAFAKKPA